MSAPRQGRTHRASGGHDAGARLVCVRLCDATLPACVATAALLAGCGQQPTSGAGGGFGVWGFVSLALLLATVAAYTVGSLRRRHAAERSVRLARAEQRQWAALAGRGDAWVWQTDASHRLLSWQGPSLPPQRQCALFDDAGLTGVLRAEQAFAGVRVRLPTAQDGSCGWELRGVPGHDDQGLFTGYLGSARPTDQADLATDAAAALQALLAQAAGPVLVLRRAGAQWQVLHANAAALAMPAADAADADADADADAATAGDWTRIAAALPALVRQAIDAAASTAGPSVVDGWSVTRTSPLADGATGLVVSRLQPAAPAAAAATSGQAAPPSTAAASAAADQARESDNFSFTVSHDLRAPIRVVEGFTRIVKEDYGRLLDRVGNDHLDRVLGAAARMNLMIDALLTLARLSQQPLARQPVNLSQLAGYIVDDLKRSTPERECDVDIEPGLTTQGDPTLLRLVLENLLGNAWKYSARNPRSRISLRTVPHNGQTAYEVRDNGAGFDMRSADRLFGLFQRLHSASEFPGHGVGLASVRRIVRRHGGEIWAEAEPGRGAAFFFTLH